MTLTLPADWPAMVQGVRDWVADELARHNPAWSAIWGRYVPTGPQPPRPFAWISQKIPPVQVGQAVTRSIAGCAIQISSTVLGATYSVTYGGVDAVYASLLTDDAVAIRAGIAGAINAVAGSTVAQDIDDLVQVSVGTVGTDDPKLVLRSVRETVSHATIVFGVDLIGRDAAELVGGGRWESIPALMALQSSLETPEAGEAWRQLGLTWRVPAAIRRPEAFEDTGWTDRSGIDLRFGCTLRALRVGDWIDDVVVVGA